MYRHCYVLKKSKIMLFYIELSLSYQFTSFIQFRISICQNIVYFIFLVLSSLLLLSHLQSIFITIKIEATKKRDDILISANWGQHPFSRRKI